MTFFLAWRIVKYSDFGEGKKKQLKIKPSALNPLVSLAANGMALMSLRCPAGKECGCEYTGTQQRLVTAKPAPSYLFPSEETNESSG